MQRDLKSTAKSELIDRGIFIEADERLACAHFG
jgi:hypothetical protein